MVNQFLKKCQGNSLGKGINCAGIPGYPYGKKYQFFITHKNSLKWIIDIKVNAQTLKLLKQNIGENLSHFSLNRTFLDRIN